MRVKVMNAFKKNDLVALSGIMMSTGVASAEVRVHGATTVTFGLMVPQKEAIEKLAATSMTILPSSSSRGLADLVEGKADVAMLAEPFEDAAANMLSKQPGSIDPEGYVGVHVGNAFVQFIVHGSNPVKSLSKEQLAGLFSGKIKSWAEVGGNNVPVLLVGEPSSAPHRMIQEALEINYAPDLRAVQNTNQNAQIAAQVPGALSYLTTAHNVPERGALGVLESEVQLPLGLFLAYRKDADANVKAIVEAAKSVGN